MAREEIKISELAAASAIVGTEEIAIVQSSTTVKSTTADLLTYILKDVIVIGGTNARIQGSLDFSNGTQDNQITVNNTQTTGSVITQGYAINFTINSNGNDGMRLINGNTGSTTIEFEFQEGDGYFNGDVSALTFTDRTPCPETEQEAIDAIMSITKAENYDKKDKTKQLDHSKLHTYLKGKINEKITMDRRDLSANVSCNSIVIQNLLRKINELNSRIEAIENNG